jgi:uncharacterized repeat protein (TIGR01451 family)
MRRTLIAASISTVVVLTSLVTVAFAVCVPTVYNVTSSAPPPLGNWTDTSGAVWSPPAGFPGCATGDTASDLNATPTTLIVNSLIPNPISGLNLSCPGCAVDIQSGGQLTLAGGGSISSSSTIIVEPGGQLTIANGGTLDVKTGASLSINGGIVDVQTGGAVTFNGASTVTNGGTLQLNNGTLTFNNTFTVQSSGTVALNGGTVNGSTAITNNGTIQQNSGTTSVSSPINSSSSAFVNVNGGTLSLSGGGTGDAPHTIAAGGTLDFPGGSYTLTTNGVVSGAGTLQVEGATLSIGGVTSPANYVMSSGTLTGAGFLTVSNNMDWSGGIITGSGGTQIAGTATGSFSAANGTMTLDGRSFDDYGYIHFTATSNELYLSNGAMLSVYGTFAIENDGTIGAGSANGTINVSPNGVFMKSGGTGVSNVEPDFNNNSTVWGFTGTLNIVGSGTDNGSFGAYDPGTIQFSGPVTTLTSNSQVFGNGKVAFSNGATDIAGFFGVDGLTAIGNASVTVDTNASTNKFSFAGTGILTVNNAFTLTNTGTFSGGTIAGLTGSFYVQNGATLTIDATGGFPIINGGEIANDGTLIYNSTLNALEIDNAGDIYNTGTFDIQTDVKIIAQTGVIVGSGIHRRVATASLPHRQRRHVTKSSITALCSCSPAVINLGTLKKTAGAGTIDFQPELDTSGTFNILSGTIQFDSLGVFQDGGTTTLGPGNITMVGAPYTLTSGKFQGAGTLTGDLSSTGGDVAPGGSGAIGTINITGAYTQGSAAAMTIELASLASYDILAVGGATTLDGTLNVSLISSYSPANGDVLQPHTFASRTGDFATKNLPTWAAGHGSFSQTYTPTALVLTAVVTPLSTDLSASMSGPSTINAGQPLSYGVTITNNGPDPTAGTITVVDTLPAGISGPSGSGTGWSCGAPSAGTITCTNTASISTGGQLPLLTFSMTAPSNGGSVSNSATVSVAGSNDPNAPNNTGSVPTTVVAQADLSVSKTGPNGVTAGQNITYTVVVTNNGPSTATSVSVSDPTPAGVTFVSNTGACTGAYPCSLGTLTSGQSATITSTYSTPGTLSGNVTNTATVSSATADPDNSNNSSSKTTNVGAQADLSVVKTGTASANPGQNIVYTVVVNNGGPSPATNVIVSDPTPVGVAFVSNTGACTSTYPCNLGTLTAGQTATITSTYTIPGTYNSPQVNNTATVSSSTNDPNPVNNTSTATTTVNLAAQADLSITKSGPASISLGQNIVYTTVVTNGGPLVATGVVVTDPTPAGLTFVSNSGACSGAFPCNVGTLNVGQSATITSTFNVPLTYPGTTITNTASCSTTATEINLANNSSTAVTNIAAAAGTDLSVRKYGPTNASSGGFVDFEIDVFNNGPAQADNVSVADPTPSGLTYVSNSGACSTPFPCALGTISAGASRSIITRYLVTATSGSTVTNTATVTTSTTDTNNANNSSQASVVVIPCPNTAPHTTAPANGAVVTSPVVLSWSTVTGATGYIVAVTGTSSTVLPATTDTQTSLVLPAGSYSWTVQATFASGCPSRTSTASAFTVCNVPDTPLASVIGESTTGQTYRVQWTAVGDAVSYELQEAGDALFTNPTSIPVSGNSHDFTKTATAATPFFYRVRAITSCAQSAFSPVISIVIIPVPKPTDPRFNVVVPDGSTTPVVFQIFIPGLPSGPVSFIATPDRPWLAVIPSSGVVPPEGTLLTISVDPSDLVNGTWTGTILVVYNIPASGKVAPNGSQTTSIPVSISLVTPITPGTLPGPTANTLVIPTVGHLFGVDSQWQSDIRIANLTSSKTNYVVTFNSGTGNPSVPTKQTTLSIDPGATAALDDIVRQWFGVGSLGDSANGILFIQAVDAAGRPLSGRVPNDVSVNKTVAVSSRTYNTTASATSPGTLGQFVPATAFANFIGRAGGGAAASILSLQQIAQTDAFRTNLGLVEASGKAVSLNVGVFDSTGNQLLQSPFTLGGGQQLQLNSFLAQNNITLTNGHIQVAVTSGDGRVQSYASVIDTKTGDPFLVSGTALGAAASNYVVPGVGDLNTGNASWRTDVRIFNAGAAPQTTTLTYYPNGAPSNSATTTVSVNPGEVKALDGVVNSLFGLSNSSGALHVTTPTDSPLVITARTFDQTSGGTLGQFIPAVTTTDAVGRNDRALQVLQAEESVHYRTNLGIAEVTGNPVTVEVSVFLPDSKVIPKVSLTLGANESRQIPILSSLGIGATYNARLAVRVTDGAGKVTAYGSVVDMTTQAPTYIPAQ